MLIGSRSGRLANTGNHEIALFRWMGSNVAVYDVRVPSEGGLKVRKNPFLRRGKNRRGRRSARGGRKRRALAGDAPVTTRPPPPERRVVSNCSKRRFEHKQNYSRTLIRYFTLLSEKRASLKEKVRNLSNEARLDVDVYSDRVANMGKTLTRLRRSWFLYAKSSGDPPGFIEMRFRLLTQGLDQVHRSEIRKLGPGSLMKLRSDWYGELVSEVVVKQPEEVIDAGLGCPSCGAAPTRSRICRHCGVDKSDPARDPLSGSSYLRGGKFGRQLPRGVGRGVQYGVFDGPAVPYIKPEGSSESTRSRANSRPKRGRKAPARPSPRR